MESSHDRLKRGIKLEVVYIRSRFGGLALGGASPALGMCLLWFMS